MGQFQLSRCHGKVFPDQGQAGAWLEGLGNIRVGRRAPSLLFLALDFPPSPLSPVRQDSEGDWVGEESLLAGAFGTSYPIARSSESLRGLPLLLHLPASTTGLGAPWGLGRSVCAPHIHLAPASAERWLGTNRGVWGLGVGALMLGE